MIAVLTVVAINCLCTVFSAIQQTENLAYGTKEFDTDVRQLFILRLTWQQTKIGRARERNGGQASALCPDSTVAVPGGGAIESDRLCQFFLLGVNDARIV